MLDLSQVKLGALPFVPQADDLHLAKYIGDAGRLIELSQVPVASRWSHMPTPGGALPVPDRDPLGNLGAGCCVFSMIAHHIRLVGQLIGDPFLASITAQDVIDEYRRRTGYDPVTGANDNGYIIRVAIQHLIEEGMFGVKALAACLVGPSWEERTIANWLGCGTYGGFSLPLSAQTQRDATGRQLWYVPEGGFPRSDQPGSWGRHGILSENQSPNLQGGNSWGDPDTVWTPEWDSKCCDERWLVLLEPWVQAGRAPNGFAFDDLVADVRARGAKTAVMG